MLIGRELDERGITVPADIGAALGMPAAEATKLLTRLEMAGGRCGAVGGRCGPVGAGQGLDWRPRRQAGKARAAGPMGPPVLLPGAVGR